MLNTIISVVGWLLQGGLSLSVCQFILRASSLKKECKRMYFAFLESLRLSFEQGSFSLCGFVYETREQCELLR